MKGIVVSVKMFCRLWMSDLIDICRRMDLLATKSQKSAMSRDLVSDPMHSAHVLSLLP